MYIIYLYNQKVETTNCKIHEFKIIHTCLIIFSCFKVYFKVKSAKKVNLKHIKTATAIYH